MPKSYDSHPFADIFHLHEGAPLWEMSDDIKTNGLRFPIILFEGKILDGRRRLLACHRAKVEPKFKAFKGSEEEALKYVRSANLFRRHLGESERAMAAAAFLKNFQEICQKQRENENSERINALQAPPTVQNMADDFNVSARSVTHANKIEKDGTEALKKAVHDELVSVTDAVAITDKPAAVQDAAVAAVRAGEANTLKAATQSIEAKNEQPKDSEGHAVPPASAEAFADLARYKSIDSLCRQLQKEIDELARLPGGAQLRRFLKAVGDGDKQIFKSDHLGALKRDLKGARPHSVCPFCAGIASPGCIGCSGHGWVTEITWKNADDKVKGRLAS